MLTSSHKSVTIVINFLRLTFSIALIDWRYSSDGHFTFWKSSTTMGDETNVSSQDKLYTESQLCKYFCDLVMVMNFRVDIFPWPKFSMTLCGHIQISSIFTQIPSISCIFSKPSKILHNFHGHIFLKIRENQENYYLIDIISLR